MVLASAQPELPCSLLPSSLPRFGPLSRLLLLPPGALAIVPMLACWLRKPAAALTPMLPFPLTVPILTVFGVLVASLLFSISCLGSLTATADELTLMLP